MIPGFFGSRSSGWEWSMFNLNRELEKKINGEVSFETQKVALASILKTDKELRKLLFLVDVRWINWFEQKVASLRLLAPADKRRWVLSVVRKREATLKDSFANLAKTYDLVKLHRERAQQEGGLKRTLRTAGSLACNLIHGNGCKSSLFGKNVSYSEFADVYCFSDQSIFEESVQVRVLFADRAYSNRECKVLGGKNIACFMREKEEAGSVKNQLLAAGYEGVSLETKEPDCCEILIGKMAERLLDQLDFKTARFVVMEFEALLVNREDYNILTVEDLKRVFCHRLQKLQSTVEKIDRKFFSKLKEILLEDLEKAPEYRELEIAYKAGTWQKGEEKEITCGLCTLAEFSYILRFVEEFFEEGEVREILSRELS